MHKIIFGIRTTVTTLGGYAQAAILFSSPFSNQQYRLLLLNKISIEKNNLYLPYTMY